MRFGYTIADAASRRDFEEAAQFIVEELHFEPTSDTVEDVDGSLYRKFAREDGNLTLVSDEDDGDLDIISDVELQITSLHEWTER